MVKHGSLAVVTLLLAALGLGGCSSGTSTSAGSASSHTSVAVQPSTGIQSSVASAIASQAASISSGDFCTAIGQAHAYFLTIAPTLAKAYATGKFSSIKQELESFWAAAVQGLAKVESTMTSAPANVQAALTTVNKAYAQFQSAVANSTSEAQLAVSMGAVGNNLQMRQADQTLTAYGKSQCGSLATSTP